MVLADLLSAVTGLVTDTVPDLGVFIAAGVVIGLGVVTAQRFIRAGR